MSVSPLSVAGVGRRRLQRAKVADRVFTGFLWSCAVVAMLPLVFIVGYVVSKGVGAINVSFFVKEPAIIGQSGGGIAQAFVGSGLMMVMSVALSVPLGLLAAVYLAEYGRGRLAVVVRFIAEVLLSTPSIVAGAVIWSIVVVRMGSFSALAGSMSLAVLMWPIIARAAEDILRLVPRELREAGTALGASKSRVILRVVIPAAAPGLVNACLLALARGFGETAPILLTSLGSEFMNTNILKPTDALPLRIFSYARSPVAQWHDIAWAGALMLLVIVLVLSIGARIFSDRERRKLS